MHEGTRYENTKFNQSMIFKTMQMHQSSVSAFKVHFSVFLEYFLKYLLCHCISNRPNPYWCKDAVMRILSVLSRVPQFKLRIATERLLSVFKLSKI